MVTVASSTVWLSTKVSQSLSPDNEVKYPIGLLDLCLDDIWALE